MRVIDDIWNLLFNLFSVLTFSFPADICFHSNLDREWQETAIFFQQTFNPVMLQKFFAVFANMKDDIGTAFFAIMVFHLIFRIAIANPSDCLWRLLIRTSDDLYRVGHHEGRIKAQSKMTDDVCFALVLLDKLLCAAQG